MKITARRVTANSAWILLEPVAIGRQVWHSKLKRQKGCPETDFEFLKAESGVILDAEVDFEASFSWSWANFFVSAIFGIPNFTQRPKTMLFTMLHDVIQDFWKFYVTENRSHKIKFRTLKSSIWWKFVANHFLNVDFVIFCQFFSGHEPPARTRQGRTLA